MIGKLTGTIDSVGDDFLILDVQGVGYLVHCSARTRSEISVMAREGSAYIDEIAAVGEGRPTVLGTRAFRPHLSGERDARASRRRSPRYADCLRGAITES